MTTTANNTATSAASEHILTSEQRGTTIADSLSRLVGHTPMVMLSPRVNDTHARIALKLEQMNPMRSVKDRVALNFIETAERVPPPGATAPISPDRTVIVEISSGNTTIGLAMVARPRGYRVVCIVPDCYSVERRAILLAMGCEVVLSPASLGFHKGAEKLAYRIMDEIRTKDGKEPFYCNQFRSPENSAAHESTTGPEIWRQTNGAVDVFVGSCGTAGTVSGVARCLKAKNPAVRIVTWEPAECAVLHGCKPHHHPIQGVGPGFDNSTTEGYLLDRSVIDEILLVRGQDAVEMARRLARTDGLIVGVSSGASVCCALEVARRPEMAGKLIVCPMQDSGERYYTTELFAEVWSEIANLPVTPAEELMGGDDAAAAAGDGAASGKK